MTTPPTPLPKPDRINATMTPYYTADQLRKYGEAEYRRGIEDAAVLSAYLGLHSMAVAIRKLGEKP